MFLTLFSEDVGGARGEMGSCCGVNVGEAAETVGEEKDVGVAAYGQGQRTEIIDADGDAWVA